MKQSNFFDLLEKNKTVTVKIYADANGSFTALILDGWFSASSTTPEKATEQVVRRFEAQTGQILRKRK